MEDLSGDGMVFTKALLHNECVVVYCTAMEGHGVGHYTAMERHGVGHYTAVEGGAWGEALYCYGGRGMGWGTIEILSYWMICC